MSPSISARPVPSPVAVPTSGKGADVGGQLGAQGLAAEQAAGDDEIAAEGLRHAVVDGALERGGEHGEQRDDADADHQGRRGAGGAPGVAHRVLTGERARDAA